MNYSVACLLLAFVVIGFTQAEEKCTPGHQKSDGCNTCTCTDTGIYACTLKFCFKKRAAEEKCVPGEKKQEDCNTCVCTKAGLFACTRKRCLKKRSAADEKCSPGQTRQEDCNTCFCTETGIFACTRKLCLKKRSAEDKCSPGETRQEDCNTCTCTETGVFACTRKLCIDKREIPARFNTELTRAKRDQPLFADLSTTPCAPNDFFKIDCNTCYCNTDRTGYLCTENICTEGNFDLSTTSQIPLTNDSMLIVSNHGVELVENVNSNDNSISRIAKTFPESEDQTKNSAKKRL